MSKKELNQNDKINLDLIDTFETNFTFSNKSINRFKTHNSNDHQLLNIALRSNLYYSLEY